MRKKALFNVSGPYHGVDKWILYLSRKGWKKDIQKATTHIGAFNTAIVLLLTMLYQYVCGPCYQVNYLENLCRIMFGLHMVQPVSQRYHGCNLFWNLIVYLGSISQICKVLQGNTKRKRRQNLSSYIAL